MLKGMADTAAEAGQSSLATSLWAVADKVEWQLEYEAVHTPTYRIQEIVQELSNIEEQMDYSTAERTQDQQMRDSIDWFTKIRKMRDLLKEINTFDNRDNLAKELAQQRMRTVTYRLGEIMGLSKPEELNKDV